MGILWQINKKINGHESHTSVTIVIIIFIVTLTSSHVSAPDSQQRPQNLNDDATTFSKLRQPSQVVPTPKSTSSIRPWPSHLLFSKNNISISKHNDSDSNHQNNHRTSSNTNNSSQDEAAANFMIRSAKNITELQFKYLKLPHKNQTLDLNDSVRSRHVRQSDGTHHWQQLTNQRFIHSLNNSVHNVHSNDPISIQFAPKSSKPFLNWNLPTVKNYDQSGSKEKFWNIIPTIAVTTPQPVSRHYTTTLRVSNPKVVVLPHGKISSLHWGSSGATLTPYSTLSSGLETNPTAPSLASSFKLAKSPTTTTTTAPASIGFKVNTKDPAAAALLSTAPSTIWYKPTINHYGTQNSTDDDESANDKKILFKIWSYEGNELKPHGEREVPGWILNGYNIADGEIINLQQIPKSLKKVVSSVIQEQHENGYEDIMKRYGPSQGQDQDSHYWQKLPVLVPGSGSSGPSKQGHYNGNSWSPNSETPTRLNYVVWSTTTTPRPNPLHGIRVPVTHEDSCEKYHNYFEQFIQRYFTSTTTTTAEPFPHSPVKDEDTNWDLLHDYLQKQMTTAGPQISGETSWNQISDANMLGNVAAMQWVLTQMGNKDIPESPTSRPGFSSPSDVTKLKPPHRNPFWAYLNPIYQHLLNKNRNRNRVAQQLLGNTATTRPVNLFLDGLGIPLNSPGIPSSPLQAPLGNIRQPGNSQLGTGGLFSSASYPLGTFQQPISNIRQPGLLQLPPGLLTNGLNSFANDYNGFQGAGFTSPSSLISFTEATPGDGLEKALFEKSQKKVSKKKKRKKTKRKKLDKLGWAGIFDPAKYKFDIFEVLKQKFLSLLALKLAPLALLAMAVIIPLGIISVVPLIGKILKYLKVLKNHLLPDSNQHEQHYSYAYLPSYPDYFPAGDGSTGQGTTLDQNGHDIHHHFHDYTGPTPAFPSVYGINQVPTIKLDRISTPIVDPWQQPYNPELDTQYNRQVMEILMNNKNVTLNSLLSKWNLQNLEDYTTAQQILSPRSANNTATNLSSHKFRRRKNV